MNLPTATAALAARALEPAFGAAVDVARQEVAALAAVLGGIGLRDRSDRTARPGFRILPMLAGILVVLAEDVGGRVAGEGEIGLGRCRRPGRHCDRAGVAGEGRLGSGGAPPPGGLGERAGEVAVLGLGVGTFVVAGKAATAGAEP